MLTLADIGENEVELTAIRASGPGGQNVNKVSSAIHLRFDVMASSLPDAVKQKMLKLPDARVTADGIIIIKAQKFRSQEKNRLDAMERLDQMLRLAQVVRKQRRETRPSKGSVRRRLDKEILGIDHMQVHDFPDSGVHEVTAKTIKQALTEDINDFKPTVVIGFDETVGLYGHEDHRLAGLYLHELLEEAKFEFVEHYYMVTLPQATIQFALKTSRIFRDRYPKNPEDGLPKADTAVSIWAQGSSKKRVLQAHKTQWKVINDVQPFGLVTPAFLYYRIFDREYFHKVALGEG